MNKFLVVFLSVVFGLVSVFGVVSFADTGGTLSAGVYVFADSFSDAPASDSFISFDYQIGSYSDGVFTVDEMLNYTFSTFVIGNDNAGSLIIQTDGTDVETLASYENYSLQSGSFAISVETDQFISSDEEFGYLSQFLVSPTSSSPVVTSLLDDVVDFFAGALGIGSTLITFISSHWFAVIPLVLWVLIALFGVFRRLFKGA